MVEITAPMIKEQLYHSTVSINNKVFVVGGHGINFEFTNSRGVQLKNQNYYSVQKMSEHHGVTNIRETVMPERILLIVVRPFDTQ